MIDHGLDEAVARLPERYEPIYASKREADLPRAARILSTLELISEELGRPLRILDLGSAQGYYGFLGAARGHQVTGVENLPADIEVARAIAEEHPHLEVDFVEADIVDVSMGVEAGDFDVVLGLSILHHLIHGDGHATAVAVVRHLAKLVTFGIFEMALRSEPVYWATSLPNDPRATLAPFPFIPELAWSSYTSFGCGAAFAVLQQHSRKCQREAVSDSALRRIVAPWGGNVPHRQAALLRHRRWHGESCCPLWGVRRYQPPQ